MTETIEIDISLVAGGGADEVWIVIDNQDVRLINGRNASYPVKREIKRHSYVIWVDGKPGSFATLTIKQDGKTLATGKPTVANGNRARVEPGGFEHN